MFLSRSQSINIYVIEQFVILFPPALALLLIYAFVITFVMILSARSLTVCNCNCYEEVIKIKKQLQKEWPWLINEIKQVKSTKP